MQTSRALLAIAGFLPRDATYCYGKVVCPSVRDVDVS